MKRFLLLLGVAGVFALILLTCGPQAPPEVEEAATTEADVAAIRALAEQWINAFEAGDVEGMVALYTDDAVRFPPDGPSYSGKAVFEEHLRGVFEESTFEVVWPVEGTEEIVVAGNWAYHLSEYTDTATPKEGGETIAEEGKVLVIVERQADGSWKFSREIWNVTPPPETEE